MRDAWGRHAGSDAFEALRETTAAEPTAPELIAASAAFGEGEEPLKFLIDRFVVAQRDAGVPAEIVRAIVPALATIDLVDIVNRIGALTDFLASEDGATLMAGYRRAANILRAEEKSRHLPSDSVPLARPRVAARTALYSAPRSRASTRSAASVGLPLSAQWRRLLSGC